MRESARVLASFVGGRHWLVTFKVGCLLPVGIRRQLALASRPLVFMTGNRTFWMISCIFDTFDDFCFVCLIVFGQLSHALIGSFTVQRQCLRISGLSSALRPCLP